MRRTETQLSTIKRLVFGNAAGRGARLAILTFVVAALIALPSQSVAGFALVAAVPLLLLLIFVGILFDMIGVAATVASEVPFHAMASKKMAGARHCLRIIRNAAVVSSFTNDLVGDILGTLTGALGVAIAFRVMASHGTHKMGETVAIAFVAALTVGGKAAGKQIALNYSTDIIARAGVVLYWVERVLHIRVLADAPRRRSK